MSYVPIIHVQPGDVVEVVLPWSEVCVHMKVAGRRAKVQFRKSPEGHTSAQILRKDDTPFSSPVSPGEAGIFWDSANGWYVVDRGPTCDKWIEQE